MKLFPFDKFIQKYKVRGYFKIRLTVRFSKRNYFYQATLKLYSQNNL